MGNTVPVPKEVMKQLISGLSQVEEALATIEELANKEGLARIKDAEDDYKRGDYVELKKGESLQDVH